VGITIKPNDKLIHFIKEMRKTIRQRHILKSDSKLASLDYTIFKELNNYFALNKSTGRHTIKSGHNLPIGSPIKGDLKYGFDKTILTVAFILHKLVFVHPVTKDSLSIIARYHKK
jgi:23S rRNA pseudouridine1911/1915/1917 synthase